MKKTLLAILGIVASMTIFAACGEVETTHTHDWATDWSQDDTNHWHDCTDETCTDKSDEAAHSGGSASCTDKAVCDVCGTPYGSVTAHVYANEVVDAAYLKSSATCTAEAVYYKSCVCGAVDKSEDAATFTVAGLAAHVFDKDCTTDDKCANCDATAGANTSHTFDSDCTTDDKCENCDVTAGANTSHTFDKDCTTDDKCENCDVTAGAADEHVFDKDCTTDDKCENCDATAGANTSHTFDNDCTTDDKCENCDVTAGAATAHVYDNDCTTADKCANCEQTASAHTHTFVNGSGTCTNEGCNVIGIATVADFQAIENDMTAHYILTTDLALGSDSNHRFNYALGFNKSDKGSEGSNVPFTGTLDGNGHTLTYNYSWVSDLTNHDKCLIYIIGETGVVKNLSLKVGTDTNNGVRRSALAWMNKGTVENVYVEMTYNNTAQSGSTNAAAGLVYTNNGTINNCFVNLTYTGTTVISTSAQLYGVCVLNNEGASITNTVLVTTITQADVGTIAYQLLNDGTKTNTPLYTSYADFYAAKDSIVESGFVASGWTITESAIALGGSVHVHATATEYSTDPTSHWNACTCDEKVNESAHAYINEVVDAAYLKSAATCKAEAVYYKSCVCGAVDKSEDAATFTVAGFAAHTPEADDGNCTTEVICSVCGVVTTEGEADHAYTNACDTDCNNAGCTAGNRTTEHTPNADDGDCTSEVKCSVCRVVTTEAKAAHVFDSNCTTDDTCQNEGCSQTAGAGTHVFDDDCTTDDKCASCDATAGANASHTFDSDCTTDDTCQNEGCSQTAGAESAHAYTNACDTDCNNAGCTAGDRTTEHSSEDDGDCTSEVKCSVCDVVTTEAKDVHVYDNDCTTADKCANCDVTATANASHTFTDGAGTCTVDGCEIIGIATADQFKAITSGATAHYVLTADIDLGTYNTGTGVDFAGILDGNGYTITYATGAAHDKALFGTMSGTVKNLNVSISVYAGNQVRIAAIAKTNTGVIENVCVEYSASVAGQGSGAEWAKAGIVMTNSGTINNAIVVMNYTGDTSANILGFCAVNNSGAIISNSALINLGTVVSEQTTNNGTKTNVISCTSIAEFATKLDEFKAAGYTGTNYPQVTVVTTADQFKAIESGATGYYVLANDIDLGTYNTGTGVNFAGILDGNGYTITYATGAAHDKALFGTMSGTVKNLNVSISVYAGNQVRIAAIAATNTGVIENVCIEYAASVAGQGGNATYAKAGIVMTNSGTINNAIVVMNYTGDTSANILGFCAVNDSGATISNSALINLGTVVSEQTTNNGTKTNVVSYTSVAEFAADTTFWAGYTGTNYPTVSA